MKPSARCARGMAVRNIIVLVVVTLMLSATCYPQLKSATQEEPVFRAPFELKLRVDNEHYYKSDPRNQPSQVSPETISFRLEGDTCTEAESDLLFRPFKKVLAQICHSISPRKPIPMKCSDLKDFDHCYNFDKRFARKETQRFKLLEYVD